MCLIWEYLDRRDRRPFSLWRERLSKLEQARLDDKMRALQVFGTQVAFLKPVSKFPHLKKLRVVVPDQALRPLLCVGPFDMTGEFTMLAGAREQNFEFDPPGVREEAERRRLEIMVDRTRRVIYEVPK